MSFSTARHAACSWRGEWLSERRKPPAGLPHHGLNPASAQDPAPWLRASGHRCSLLHRRRCPTAPASKQPLAGLRLAGGYRVGCSTAPSRCAPRLYLSCYRRPASADFCPWQSFARAARRLRRQLRSRLRRLPQGWLARCARLHPGRPGVNRKRLNITAHYPKSGQSLRRLRFVARPLRALRVRVMVCYVLRPQPSNCVIRRCAGFQSALRDGWPTLNLWAALPRLWRARWPAAPGSQLVGAVLSRLTFGFGCPCPYTDQRAGFARHCPRKRLDRVRLACSPDCPAGAFPPDGGHDRKGSAR